MRKYGAISVLLVLAAAWNVQATEITLGAASGYNVFTLNNFTEYNTDAQGKMAVGGNFNPTGGSFTIAGASTDPAGVYDLVVGGNFTMTGNSMGGGDAYVAGTMTWNDPSLPHNAYVVGSFVNGQNGGSTGGTIYYGGAYSSGDALSNSKVAQGSIAAPINFTAAATNLDSVSTTLAGEAANGTVSVAYNTYTLTGTNSNLNIFNLTASSYSSATINITAPSTSTVVINVAGTSASFTYGSIDLNGVPDSNVIFNFDQATTLALNGIGFNGSILAPFASFTGTWGDIDGELITLNAAGTTQINDEIFTGSLGSTSTEEQNQTGALPEPSTWVLALGGIGLVAFRRARQLLSRGR